MIEGLKPYKEYKSLDAKTVPSAWTVVPLKALSAVQSGVTLGKKWEGAQELHEYPYLAVANVQQDRLKLDKVKRIQLPAHEARRALLVHGDVLVTEGGDPDKLGRGCLWRAELPECLHQNHVFAVRPKQQHLLPEYLVRFLSSPEANEYFIRRAKQTTNLASTNKTTLGNLPIALPPPDEQAAIVKFIDYADRRIRRYIRAKQKLLRLQSETVASVTDAAVSSSATKTVRLSTAATQVFRPVTRDAETEYVPVGLYNRGRGMFAKPSCPGAELGDSDFFWLEGGDLILSGQFAWEGAVAMVSAHHDGCIASHRYPVLRGKPNVALTAFLLGFFRSSYGHLLLNLNSRGAAGRNRPLNMSRLMKEKVPVPPLELQDVVVHALQQEATLRAAVARDIALITEYRTRLIADVVTGKLDVRQAAANLPDEIDTDEPELDESGDMEDADDIEAEESDE